MQFTLHQNTHTFFLILIIILGTSLHGLLVADEMHCNGYAEFCDRRYNEIAQINSHNATSYGSSPVQDQDRTIQQQLDDGIRVFKLPLHFDYKNKSDYYADLIQASIIVFDNKIKSRLESIASSKKDVFDAIASAQRDVDSLGGEINSAQNTINDLTRWYDKLDTFSFSESSKTTRALDYAVRVSAFAIEKKALELARVVAKGVLSGAESTAAAFIEQDPRLILLKTQKFAAEKTLGLMKKEGTQEIFACHALAKREIYGKFVDQLINKAPDSIRPVVNFFLTPLSALETHSIELLFGTPSAPGGIMPYPACLLDSPAMSLKDFLREIKGFLEKNPHDVVTILLNDFIYDPIKITKVFKNAGLMSYVYAQDRDKPWPTFRELIETGERLIVFTDVDYDRALYPWLNYRNFYNAWDGSYDFKSTDIFTNPQTPLEKFGDFAPRSGADVQTIRSQIANPKITAEERKSLIALYKKMAHMVEETGARNMLLDITHAVTQGLAGSKSAATVINKRSVFRAHMKRIAEAARHIPNSISIDFYEYPNEANPKGDVFDVIDELNGVGKYSGNPLWSPSK